MKNKNYNYRMLLVEDNPLDRMAFLEMLKNDAPDYDCTVADSVTQAKPIIESEQFDIVVTDYQLGDGTAFDIIPLVKDAPIILITGGGSEDVALRAWREGTYDYLVKDVDLNYLKTVPITIANAIRHYQMERKLHLLTQAVASTEDAIFIMDMDKNIIFSNESFTNIYGYTAAEIMGKNCSILWEPPKGHGENGFDGIKHWETGYMHYTRSGEEIPVSLTLSPVHDDNDRQVATVGVARNISEHVFTQNLLQTLEKLREGNRMMQ